MKAKDLHTPQQYEVVKLKIGTELVAMTRDRADKLELTLPSIPLHQLVKALT